VNEITELHRRRFTAAEFARLEFPPCPVCGTTAQADRLDCTTRADIEEGGERMYLVGRWSCPRGCNPTTGQRFHGSYNLRSDIGMDGYYRFECSCGFEDLLTWAQVGEALAKHKSGTFS
jgi:hypothetical protein